MCGSLNEQCASDYECVGSFRVWQYALNELKLLVSFCHGKCTGVEDDLAKYNYKCGYVCFSSCSSGGGGIVVDGNAEAGNNNSWDWLLTSCDNGSSKEASVVVDVLLNTCVGCNFIDYRPVFVAYYEECNKCVTIASGAVVAIVAPSRFFYCCYY